MDRSVVASPLQRMALESPTLMENSVFSCITTPMRVQPEKAISMPKRSSSNSTFLSACLMIGGSNLC